MFGQAARSSHLDLDWSYFDSPMDFVVNFMATHLQKEMLMLQKQEQAVIAHLLEDYFEQDD